MAPHLLPCPVCTRHVRVSELTCPFCASTLDADFRSTPRPVRPARNLGRAAIFAFGVATAPTLVACGGGAPKPDTRTAAQPAAPSPVAQPGPTQPQPVQPTPPPPDDDDYGSVQAEYGVAPYED